jgi:myo-inositol-1(or 4)-monophosphatase
MPAASDELTRMIAAASAAGRGLMRRFRSREALRVEQKGPADFVSEADVESERTLREVLLGAYPQASFLAEEGGELRGEDANMRFIVDPLDGTSNFLHGIPHFAIAIALEKGDRLVAGVVYDVAKNELFAADAERGAWLNGHRLQVAPAVDLASALVGTGVPHLGSRVSHDAYTPLLRAVMREAAGVRRFAAAALDLAYVAAGRYAAFFELGLAPWDIAAGKLLVEEAGGRVTRLDGGDGVLASGDVLATNGRLHERMIALLRSPGSPNDPRGE